ncbi:hypothetical protein [Streptomyces sp. R33]|uniref:PASTA domain-containing protein n=1 Tax=Streptomyces sp. R33 TaxID=3238629 RepID=A0AB39YFU1_9ACTN
MAVALVDGTSAAIAAEHRHPTAAKPEAVTQAADIPSARVAARLSGKQVEALSERTETCTTWVNKNGSLTTELSAGPTAVGFPLRTATIRAGSPRTPPQEA